MQKPADYPTQPRSGWLITASAGAPALRDFSELADVDATLDEIVSRNGGTPPAPVDQQPSAVATINDQAVWANYNKGKGTPISAHSLK